VLAICAVLGFLGGLQLGALGLLAEVCTRTWLAASGQTPYRIRRRLNLDGEGVPASGDDVRVRAA